MLEIYCQINNIFLNFSGLVLRPGGREIDLIVLLYERENFCSFDALTWFPELLLDCAECTVHCVDFRVKCAVCSIFCSVCSV